ncbi:hypothetical protein ASF45_04245 [Pseudorhodoferax sp. Leaf265]|nr:hypothetical protein ASF45_04245 [Pseudorhodoferax sp. Leaf265]
MTTVLVALIVSGGPDGDGGAPDLDLMVGIGAHRSWLSHSILAGAALEGMLRAMLELVRMVHDKLPEEREPVWDLLYQRAAELTEAANRGVSLGVSYHLGVDGLVEPAAYHGLPFEMPLVGHQALFTANSLAELNDVRNKPQFAPKRPGAKDDPTDIDTTTMARLVPIAPAAPVALECPPPRTRAEVAVQTPVQRRWRDTATTEALASMKLSHKEHRLRPFTLVDRLRPQFTSDEQALLRRYGTWLRGLANGDLEPLTAEQDSFVSVVGRRSAADFPNKLFALWGRYQRAHAQNAPLGSRRL